MKTDAIYDGNPSICTRVRFGSKHDNATNPKRRFGRALIAGIVLFPLGYSSALAGTLECTQNFGAVTISDNLEVPANGECKLSGTLVEGNVKIKDGGTLTVENGAIIEGNLKADGASMLSVTGSTIDGNVDVKNSDSVEVSDSSIDGKLSVEKSESVDIRDSTVNGNVSAKKNSGDVILIGNSIEGNFKASNNDNPIIAEGNDVGGNESGQAASAELPCPCSVDLPSGWAADSGTGTALGTDCPDGSFATVRETFSNFVGFADSPFVGTALNGDLDSGCDGFVSASCQFTPGGTVRDISELQYNFCRSTFSAP